MIDIDEKTMKNLKTIYVKEGVSEEPVNITEIVRKVANGTPVADDPVIEAIKENNSKVDERPEIDFSGVKYDIDRPQGKWQHTYSLGDSNYYVCPICNRAIEVESWQTLDDFPYCHCGARLKGG